MTGWKLRLAHWLAGDRWVFVDRRAYEELRCAMLIVNCKRGV